MFLTGKPAFFKTFLRWLKDQAETAAYVDDEKARAELEIVTAWVNRYLKAFQK
ncbi:hypothetical protein [Azonexus sp. R2A61]|uniref:hypothetical protein n=1 Tax=Azonexus sp. R2A61 TaxID=2744443 RepID=UPI001F1BD526|nr:hypothetical protein [Azonexus sp. R2A61]